MQRRNRRSLKIVPDKASFSGFSFMSLDEPDKLGIPASYFEIELWRDNERLRREIESLRSFAEITANSESVTTGEEEPSVLAGGQ